jgi:periplasmic protein TonB
MRYFVVLLMLIIPFHKPAFAQDAAKTTVRFNTREKPKFPGGEEELRKFLALNLRYPNEALQKGIGGEVIVSFKIDEEGNISDVKSLKPLGFGCDEEAVKVVRKMPQWIPAKKSGKNIAVTYNLPIVFELPKQSRNEPR